MSDETRLAFAPLIERSVATAGQGDLDRISLRDHIVDVEIGAFQAERDVTQRLRFSVVVEVSPVDVVVDDDVDRILSYDRVTEAIAHELAEERLSLLETLAEKVAGRILIEPQAMRVFVRIEKLDRGPGALGVEIVRSRESSGPELAEQPQGPRPCVVYLSNAALWSENLAGWIDQLQQGTDPVVICLEGHDLPLPQAGQDPFDLRIALLGIEQNAWVLASRDARCAVVNTRTELDWSLKNGQISVWAPSKIVLDSVDGVSRDTVNAQQLALWFAGEMNASRMVAIGGSLPFDSRFPTQNVSIETVSL